MRGTQKLPEDSINWVPTINRNMAESGYHFQLPEQVRLGFSKKDSCIDVLLPCTFLLSLLLLHLTQATFPVLALHYYSLCSPGLVAICQCLLCCMPVSIYSSDRQWAHKASLYSAHCTGLMEGSGGLTNWSGWFMMLL
jgi:hypothetical protein